jgi:voltage-gated potassium channel
MAWERLRLSTFRELEPSARSNGLSLSNRVLVLLILFSTATAVVETEPTILNGHETIFRTAEVSFGVVFLFEYLARLWVAVDHPAFAGTRFPRLRYALSFPAIIDLVAVLPTLLLVAGGSTLVLRLVRILRILRLAKLGRLSSAWRDVAEAVHSRRFELLVTVALAFFAMLIASTLMYWAEGDVQPDKFGSIPRALWWSAVTLTTVGYGDVYPMTPLGKACAAIVAIAGIGLIALPTGILASAFSDAVQRRRERSANGTDG